jgi:hypothetical protein
MVQIIETCRFSIHFLELTNQVALFNIYNNSPIKKKKKKRKTLYIFFKKPTQFLKYEL